MCNVRAAMGMAGRASSHWRDIRRFENQNREWWHQAAHFMTFAPDNPIKQVQKTVSDQYGTWSVQHSQKLAHELVGVTLNEPEEAMLIDCLTGGHFNYLNFTLRPELEILVIIIETSATIAAAQSWPDRAIYFHMVASKFIDRRANKEKDELVDRVEQFSGKKCEPLAVYLATVATRFIEKRSTEMLRKGFTYTEQFSPSTFVLAALHDLFVRLGDEQSDWLIENIISPYATKSSK